MRTEHKLNSYMWFIISVLPLAVFLGVYFQSGNISEFFTFMDNFKFDFIYNLFTDLFDTAGVLNFSNFLCVYVSYIFSVELLHLIFDCTVFIIRFARKFLGGWLYE